jgi:hypothetical protein
MSIAMQPTPSQPYVISSPGVAGIDRYTYANFVPLPQDTTYSDPNKGVRFQSAKPGDKDAHSVHTEYPDPTIDKQKLQSDALTADDVLGYGMPVGDLSKPDIQSVPRGGVNYRWSAQHTPGYYYTTRSYGHDMAERFTGEAGSMAGLSQQGRVVAPGGQIKRFREMQRINPLPLAETVGSADNLQYPTGTVIPLVFSKDAGLKWW